VVGRPSGPRLSFSPGRVDPGNPAWAASRKPLAGEFKAYGKTLVIDGLWALLQGTATTGGTDALWFSAGLNQETHGLIGVLRKP